MIMRQIYAITQRVDKGSGAVLCFVASEEEAHDVIRFARLLDESYFGDGGPHELNYQPVQLLPAFIVLLQLRTIYAVDHPASDPTQKN